MGSAVGDFDHEIILSKSFTKDEGTFLRENLNVFLFPSASISEDFIFAKQLLQQQVRREQ